MHRRIATATILAAVIIVATAAVAIGGVTPQRLAGEGRIQTAIEISKHAFPEGSLEVYIAAQDVNPDALVGGALTKGPMLLVPQCGTLPSIVADEIARLAPLRVYGLGGPNTVCDSMLQQAGAAAPSPSDPGPPESYTFSEAGDRTTAPFELNGGSYQVTWDYQADCYYSASLDRLDEFGYHSLPDSNGASSGQDVLNGVDPGQWAIDMLADDSVSCPWTITVETL